MAAYSPPTQGTNVIAALMRPSFMTSPTTSSERSRGVREAIVVVIVLVVRLDSLDSFWCQLAGRRRRYFFEKCENDDGCTSHKAKNTKRPLGTSSGWKCQIRIETVAPGRLLFCRRVVGHDGVKSFIHANSPLFLHVKNHDFFALPREVPVFCSRRKYI